MVSYLCREVTSERAVMHEELATKILDLYKNRENLVNRAIFAHVCEAVSLAYGIGNNELVAHVAYAFPRGDGGVAWLTGYLMGRDKNNAYDRYRKTELHTEGYEAAREG